MEKIFVETLLDTYETRVKVTIKTMRATVDYLSALSREQAKMTLELRGIMAKKQSFRRKDFDSLLQDIVGRNLDREKEITQALDDLQKEEDSMSARLRRIVTGEEQIELSEFKLVSKEIIERLHVREKKASDLLRQFHIEQAELSEGLRKLLDKGEDIRIKDFKAMTGAIQLRHQERDSEVGKILDDLEGIQEEINLQWQDLRKNYLIKEG